MRDRLAATKARREVWAASGPAPKVDLPAFSALRREVGATRRVRLLWATSVPLGVVSAAGTLAINAYATLFGG